MKAKILLLVAVAMPALAFANTPPVVRSAEEAAKYRAARQQIAKNTMAAAQRRSLTWQQTRVQDARAVAAVQAPSVGLIIAPAKR